jgi:ASC-1-like (ASCH) protein
LNLPWFLAKKEVFEWLVRGQKTIDVRKGILKPGEIAVFQSGPHTLRLKIVKTESGQLSDILRLDNFKAIIPSALELEDAVEYFRRIYGVCDGVFTAYHVEQLVVSEKG